MDIEAVQTIEKTPLLFSELEDAGKERLAKILDSELRDKRYSDAEVGKMADSVNAACLEWLGKQSYGFKFIVHTTIVPRSDSGVHQDVSGHWDPSTDGTFVVSYSSESIIAMTRVFAFAI